MPDTEIGIYDNLGNLVANDDDDGHGLRSALSFGNTTARVMPANPFGFTNGLAANGRDGNLNAGTYWLAVGLYDATFNGTSWSVTTTATRAPSPFTVNFRTDLPLSAIPEPTGLALGLAGLLGFVGLRRRR